MILNINGKNLKIVPRADLRGANLRGADLYGANLRGANLRGADLYGANLRGADLYGANLSKAYLQGADLSRAYLSGAYLQGSYLNGADLRGADLRGADLSRAYLSGAYLPDFQIVPQEGSFIAFKKVYSHLLRGGPSKVIKLMIPECAKRTSTLVGRKCRASEATVVEAPEGVTLVSGRDNTFTYELGKTVRVEDFDDDIRVECTRGIHFFMTRKEAEGY